WTLSSSTMMVMMMAMTPSLNASSLPEFTRDPSRTLCFADNDKGIQYLARNDRHRLASNGGRLGGSSAAASRRPAAGAGHAEDPGRNQYHARPGLHCGCRGDPNVGADRGVRAG